MTNPTDPRVEAAARAIQQAIGGENRVFFDFVALDALKAADAAVWLPIETAPRNARIQLAWRDKDDKWRFDFGMASWDWKLGDYRSGVSQHHAATYWQPLPKTP